MASAPTRAPRESRAGRCWRARRPPATVALPALLGAVLVAVVAVDTFAWIGTTFPGFFLLPNRVVPSIALPEWAGGQAPRLFQEAVVAVDGVPAASAGAVYASVQRRPADTPIAYTLRRPDGTTGVAVVRSLRFGVFDYLLVFGAYLVTGVAFAGSGLVVELLARSAASRGLLALGLAGGLFLVTAADAYGQGWFFRVHALAEVFLTPAGLHLALVFPRERLARHGRRVLVGLYLAFVPMAAWYEAVLYDPARYPTAHLAATAANGIGIGVIVVLLAWDFFHSASVLVRRRVAVVATGGTLALLMPGALMGASALFGGSVPINAGAFTAFLFPASIAYAIVQRDLFTIDRVLARTITHAVVVVVTATAYLAVLAVLGFLVPPTRIAGSQLSFALVNLTFVFLVIPLRMRVTAVVDRVFFRRAYRPAEALSMLSQALVSARAYEEVAARTILALEGTVCPTSVALLAWNDAERTDGLVPLFRPGPLVPVPPALASRLVLGNVLASYEWEDGTRRQVPEVFAALGAELLVPMGSEGQAIGVIALGRKANGRAYGSDDLTFLEAVANQVALAMTNAGAFFQLATLNADLERQVEQRTASLAGANAELEKSFDELRAAYDRLERTHASLVRADRLATLGRLAAGIAHEVNTPLGAVVNALTLLRDLASEYTASIGVSTVSEADHREIASEITATTDAALGWTRKVGAFVNRIRVHGRDSAPGTVATFAVGDLFGETEALLAHRARAAVCGLAFEAAPDTRLEGDPVRLGQVLTNLVANALDAYEERGISDGVVEARAERVGDRVVITVRDCAGGIPPDVLPHVFDELFTTKPPGRGTGLGLWIARDIVEQGFRGTLEVAVEPGVGSCFTIDVPVRAATASARVAGVAPSGAVE